MTHTKRVTVQLDPERYHKLQLVAQLTDSTLSDVFRSLLDHAVVRSHQALRPELEAGCPYSTEPADDDDLFEQPTTAQVGPVSDRPAARPTTQVSPVSFDSFAGEVSQ